MNWRRLYDATYKFVDEHWAAITAAVATAAMIGLCKSSYDWGHKQGFNVGFKLGQMSTAMDVLDILDPGNDGTR